MSLYYPILQNPVEFVISLFLVRKGVCTHTYIQFCALVCTLISFYVTDLNLFPGHLFNVLNFPVWVQMVCSTHVIKLPCLYRLSGESHCLHLQGRSHYSNERGYNKIKKDIHSNLNLKCRDNKISSEGIPCAVTVFVFHSSRTFFVMLVVGELWFFVILSAITNYNTYALQSAIVHNSPNTSIKNFIWPPFISWVRFWRTWWHFGTMLRNSVTWNGCSYILKILVFSITTWNENVITWCRGFDK